MFIIINIQRKGFGGLGLRGFWAVTAQKLQSPKHTNPFLWIYARRTFNRQSSGFVGNLFSIILSSMPDIQGFVGNLSSFFPSNPVDFLGSPEIFPSFFHQPQPTSEVRLKSIQQLSIDHSRLQKFV